MNKIVRENYPASKLPEDLREGLDPSSTVRVVIEAGDAIGKPRKTFSELKKLIDELKLQPDFKPVTADEAVQRIRALRDEWDN
ncbi:MAG: hypothetical protein R3D62_07915 [Xanthobacteraceae bacterium]